MVYDQREILILICVKLFDTNANLTGITYCNAELMSLLN